MVQTIHSPHGEASSLPLLFSSVQKGPTWHITHALTKAPQLIFFPKEKQLRGRCFSPHRHFSATKCSFLPPISSCGASKCICSYTQFWKPCVCWVGGGKHILQPKNSFNSTVTIVFIDLFCTNQGNSFKRQELQLRTRYG